MTPWRFMFLLAPFMVSASCGDDLTSFGKIVSINNWPHRNPPMIIQNTACKPSKTWSCGTVTVGWTHEELIEIARDHMNKDSTIAVLLLEIERLRSETLCKTPP